MSQSAKWTGPQGGSDTARLGRARGAGDLALGAAGAALARAGFSDASLVLRWPEIAGAEIARIAEPVKLQAGSTGATLTLKCEAGAAVFLQHQTRTLTDRLNAYLGHGTITKVKLVPGRLSAPPAPSDHPSRIQNRAGKISAESGLEASSSPDLDGALSRLARRRGTASR